MRGQCIASEKTSSGANERGIELENYSQGVIPVSQREWSKQPFVHGSLDRADGGVVEDVIAGRCDHVHLIEIHGTVTPNDEHHFGVQGTGLLRKVLGDAIDDVALVDGERKVGSSKVDVGEIRSLATRFAGSGDRC